MANILIASLGDSPVVVSSMYNLLTLQKGIQIDQVRTLCPDVYKISDSYLLVDEALTVPAQKPIQTVIYDKLDFDDVTSLERCIALLSKLYAILDEHQKNGDMVYLSLAGGRKSMSALIAWIVPFFSCIKGLYHIIDPTERNFYRIEELLDMSKQDRLKAMHPTDLDGLKLVEIPYPDQQNMHKNLEMTLLNINPANTADELVEGLATLLEVKRNKTLKVSLTQRAYEQFEKLCRKADERAERFKTCFQKMRLAFLLENSKHDWKGQKEASYKRYHIFKDGRTAERPMFYTCPVDIHASTIEEVTDVIVCELMWHDDNYRPIKEVVEHPGYSDQPYKRIEDLPAIKRAEADTLIVPLGKRPMIVTQLYTLLQEREGRCIGEIVLVYPGENPEIRTSCRLIEKAFRRENPNVKIIVEKVAGKADIDDRASCELYQWTLEQAIDRVLQRNPKGEVLLSLSGGRKGMTAQTIFAAQNKNINFDYAENIKILQAFWFD